MKQKVILLLLIVLLGIPSYAKADLGLQFYTDRDEWIAAVNGDISTEEFDTVTDKTLEAGVNEVGAIRIELLNHTPSSEYNLISDDPYDLLSVNGSPFFCGIFSSDDVDSVTNLIFSNDVYAFGGDFFSAHSSINNSPFTKDTVVMEVNGAQYDLNEILDPGGDGNGFLGFTSHQAFTVVSLFDPVVTDTTVVPMIIRGSESFGLDNVSFAVPEPATLALLGLGIICFRKRR